MSFIARTGCSGQHMESLKRELIIQKMQSNFSLICRFGDAIKTVNYCANGEAADWMLAEHSVYAFSPELGNNIPESKHFYPPAKVHQSIIETDYKVVESFLEQHLPRFSMIEEYTLRGGQYYNENNGSLHPSTKWKEKGTLLELFNHAVSHLKNIQLLIAVKGPIPSKISWGVSSSAKKISSTSNLGLHNLSFAQVKGGILTAKISIKRRSYFYLKTGGELGKDGNFIIAFVKDGQRIGEFINVNNKQVLDELLSGF